MRYTPSAPRPGTGRWWRQLVCATTTADTPTVVGPHLEPGVAYELPPGVLILGCDLRQPPAVPHLARIWQLTPTGATPLAEIPVAGEQDHLLAEAGVHAELRHHLEFHPSPLPRQPLLLVAGAAAIAVDAGPCTRCGGRVEAGSGTVDIRQGQAHLAHTDPDHCVPCVMRTQRTRRCWMCAQSIPPGEGIAVGRWRDAETRVWSAVHLSCPPLPRLDHDQSHNVTSSEAVCATCCQTVAAGEGHWVPSGCAPHHRVVVHRAPICPAWPGQPHTHRIHRTTATDLHQMWHVGQLLAAHQPTSAWVVLGEHRHTGTDGLHQTVMLRPATATETTALEGRRR